MAGKKSKMKRKSTNGRTKAKTTVKKAKTTRTTRKVAAGRSTSASKTTAIKLPSVKTPMTKSGIIKTITDVTTVNKKDVSSVLECLSSLIGKHVQTGGPGKFVLPGMMKVVVVKKPARPARKGINPFTGEEIMIKAKPASKAIRIKPLKKLKEMV